MTTETILTDEQVICPKCAHQFRAIPVQVQDLLLSAGYKPPFTQSALGATASDKLIELATKAILFEDCGNTEDWKDNTNLGQAAVNAVLQSPEIQALREDAERIRALAREFDRARRGSGDSYMPIWNALCESIGSDDDGDEMLAAIDDAMEKQP